MFKIRVGIMVKFRLVLMLGSVLRLRLRLRLILILRLRLRLAFEMRNCIRS